jgi:hypothetical protein
MISKPAPLFIHNETFRAVAQAMRVAALLAVLAFLLAMLPA